MRRVIIGSLLVTQTLVLAAIFGLGLHTADAVLTGSALAPRVLVPAAVSAVTHDLRNEGTRLAMHAGFVRSEVKRVVALHANPAPTMVASRQRVETGG